MVTKAVFIDYSWKRKKIGLTKCKDVSQCVLCPSRRVSSRDILQWRKGGFVGSMCSIQSYFVLASHSVYSHSTVTLLPLYSHSAPTLHRILRRKATGAVPYTLLYIAFSGAFRRLLPRLLYWLSYVFLTSPSQDSTFAMSIGRKGETDGCANGNQPLPFDWFVN